MARDGAGETRNSAACSGTATRSVSDWQRICQQLTASPVLMSCARPHSRVSRCAQFAAVQRVSFRHTDLTGRLHQLWLFDSGGRPQQRVTTNEKPNSQPADHQPVSTCVVPTMAVECADSGGCYLLEYSGPAVSRASPCLLLLLLLLRLRGTSSAARSSLSASLLAAPRPSPSPATSRCPLSIVHAPGQSSRTNCTTPTTLSHALGDHEPTRARTRTRSHRRRLHSGSTRPAAAAAATRHRPHALCCHCHCRTTTTGCQRCRRHQLRRHCERQHGGRRMHHAHLDGRSVVARCVAGGGAG